MATKTCHVEPVGYEDFCNSLKSTFAMDEHAQFLTVLKANDSTAMGDWLGVCNAADVVPFIEAFRKMAKQYYPDKIDLFKDAVSIPGVCVCVCVCVFPFTVKASPD